MKVNETSMFMEYRREIADLRKRWHTLRRERRACKNTLLARGMLVQEIRKDRTYRHLKKEQHALSTRLKHLERKLHKKINNST